MARTVTLNFVGRDKNVTRTVQGIRGSVDKLHNRISRFAGFFGAAIAGQQVVQFFQQSITAASDLAESTSKAEVVFGKSADAVKKFGQTAATSLGMSQQQATEATATFGNLFVSMKIGQPQAAKMSTTMVQLAADLASFNNASPEETLLALRSGLVGETEPLRRFGINLNAATLKAEAAALGLGKIGPTLTSNQKAQAAYSLILKQSTTAQGDFARTSEGLANQQRILAAQTEDAKAAIGEVLLPAVLAVTGFLNESAIPALKTFAGVLGDNTEALKVIGVALAGAAAGWAAFKVGAVAATAATTAWTVAARRLTGGMDTLRLVQMEAHDQMAKGRGRISAYGSALKMAGGGAGIFRKAISGITGVFGGPWGLAITGAVAAVTLFATRNQEAEQQVQELTDAIKQDSGALGENTRAKIANILQTEGMVDQAKQLGVPLRDLIDAAMGEGEALGRVNAVLATHAGLHVRLGQGAGASNRQMVANAEAARDLGGALTDTSGKLGEARTAAKDNATMMGTAKNAAGGFDGALDGVGGAANDASGDIKDLTKKVLKNKDAFRSDKLQAIDFKIDLRELTKRIRENGGALRGNSTKALQNRAEFIRLADKVADHADELIRDNRLTDKNRRELIGQKRQLVDVAAKFFDSRKAARKYVDQLLKIPKKRSTKISVDSKGRFDWQRAPGGGPRFFAEGGMVRGPGGPTGDKIPARLSNGEFVVNAKATRQFLPTLKAINEGGRGISRTSTGQVVGDPPNLAFAKGGLVSRFAHRGDAPGSLAGARRGVKRGLDAQYMRAVRDTARIAAKIVRMFGGPGVLRALRWAKTQDGKPYIWGGVGPTGYDCSGWTSAITNMIRGRNPHQRLHTTHSFGASGGPGFARNRMSPWRVGVTHAGVGHMAGTLGRINVESSSGYGVRVGGGARGATNSLFPFRYGMVGRRFDRGGMLMPGTTIAQNGTGSPEHVLTGEQMRRHAGDIHVHLHNAGVIGSHRELEKWLTRSIDDLRRKGRLTRV